MKRFLLFAILPLLMAAGPNDTKIVPKKDGGNVVIQSVTAGGVASDAVTVGTTTTTLNQNLTVPTGKTLAVDTITNAAGTGAPSLPNGISDTYVGVNPAVGGSSPFQLTAADKRHQSLKPTSIITIKLPSVGIFAGDTWKITDRSVNGVSIQDSTGFQLNGITNGTIEFTAVVNNPTGTGSWVVTRAEGGPLPMTVTWSASTTNPSIGNGSITSFYTRSGERATAEFSVYSGTTTTYGAGQYFFTTSLSMDSAKTSANGNRSSYGSCAIFGAALGPGSLVSYNSLNIWTIMVGTGILAHNFPGVWAGNNQTFHCTFSFPVSGWSMHP